MKKQNCKKCTLAFMPYFLKNGVCNGCKNPHLIVTEIPMTDALEYFTGNPDPRNSEEYKKLKAKK